MPNNRICPYCSRPTFPNSWVAVCYLCRAPGCPYCMEDVGHLMRHGLFIGCRKRNAQHLQAKPAELHTVTSDHRGALEAQHPAPGPTFPDGVAQIIDPRPGAMPETPHLDQLTHNAHVLEDVRAASNNAEGLRRAKAHLHPGDADHRLDAQRYAAAPNLDDLTHKARGLEEAERQYNADLTRRTAEAIAGGQQPGGPAPRLDLEALAASEADKAPAPRDTTHHQEEEGQHLGHLCTVAPDGRTMIAVHPPSADQQADHQPDQEPDHPDQDSEG